MTSFADFLAQGAGNAWVFAPTAVALGALHGLEPGHSKTMMAAFVIAVRGTVAQAVLLGLSATASHTAVVWAVALAGLHWGARVSGEASEPYLQMVSAAFMGVIAVWTLWRLESERRRPNEHHRHDQARLLETASGPVRLEIFEEGVPPHWRLFPLGSQALQPTAVSLATRRPDGARQTFAFRRIEGGFESIETIPEPHAFEAELTVVGDEGPASHELVFSEHAHTFDDAHARAHAQDIRGRLAKSDGVGATQIVMFGLTSGLIPCPASITVLLVCLQLRAFALGAALVLCFSLGLAVTMVGVGVGAALGARGAAARFPGLDALARRAPYLSVAVILLIGAYTAWMGWIGLSAA